MTRDEIIRMAREADPFGVEGRLYAMSQLTPETLERFAAIVAAAEREAGQRAFWEACRPHGKVGEVIYTTYKHLRARSTP